MKALKTAGSVILGFAVLVGLIVVSGILTVGTAAVAAWLLPFLIQVNLALLILCVVILLPLSLFRRTRIVPMWGFFISSYAFGLEVWLYGFFVTYQLWGVVGLLIGLGLGVVGVVPLGMIAAIFHDRWSLVGELVFGIAITYAARAFAIFLATKLESAGGTPARAVTDVRPKAIPIRIWHGIWKSTAILVAIILAMFTASQAGWSGSKLLFYSGVWRDAHAVNPIMFFLLGVFGCVALGFFVLRIAKWGLWLFVPVALYSAFVLGVWNGIASDFDYTRGEAIKHHSANAYALEHMSRRAIDLSCHDERIQLTQDAEAFCNGRTGK